MKARKRIIAAIMAAVFTVLQVGEMVPAVQVQAASTVNVGSVNLLEHSDFEETDVDLVPHSNTAGSKLDNWSNYPDNSVTKKVQHDAHTGEWAVELTAAKGAVEQDTDELVVGENYVATVWAKLTDPSASVYFGIKDYGGTEIKQKITSAEYTQYSIPFTYTGAPAGLYARVYVWVESMNNGAVYVDDFELMSDSDLEQVSIENGKITVTYREDYTETPSKDDFNVVYTNSLNGTEKTELAITGENVNGNQLELLFDKIEQQPLEQLITADVTYLPKNQTLTVDCTVEPNGAAVEEAKAVSLEASNGIAEIVLDKVPTAAPVQSDFKLEKSVNDGAFEEVTISGFTYDKESKTVTLQFSMINVKAESQKVILKLTYQNEEKTAEFTVEAGNGTVYYVDATEGNDNNSGTSPEEAWKTIEKVNSVTFQPGDQILFQCGEVWTGSLKPQGSGIEGAPIVISSYDKGDKPVLKPGDNWTIPYFQPGAPGANGVKYNVTVNNGISFYNQEYWEVRNLELYDPTYASTTNPTVYRRGINITAEDIGDLHYFLFDNLTIHGFRGPTDNAGKSSGGIIMTAISDPYNSANRVPSAVHDITVTNCKMYDLGRSGFNFVSPWTNRTGSEWGAFGYNGYGDWKPFENITIKNNTIYNIDGDGILIDGCKNVLVEHNVVYRTVLNCWYGVGMFNWNSDNTVFQFNEVYDTFPADSLLGAGDGQGVEIDALNRDTWVQYNYIHDNTGGCIMWCSTDNLRTIRGIYRYNIFQNDLTKHGVIDWRSNHKESMVYNNTFYFGELPDGASERKFMNNGYMNGNSEAKFYNNIFYNMDEFNLNSFNEQEIDWESNIFYGFEKVPSNDSTVITEDPMFVNPGSGTCGLDSVTGYKLQAGSPAIDAGLNIEDNGGRDYFGILLTDGKTDIGAAEYLEGDSPAVPDQPKLEVTAIAVAKAPEKVKYVEGETFDPSGLALDVTYDNETTSVVRYKVHNASDFTFEPDGALTLEDTSVKITYKGKSTDLPINVVEVTEGPESAARDVAADRYTLTAGSTQSGNSVNSATDGNLETFWEAEWDIGNTYPEKLWFQIELDSAERLDALRYYPRYGTTGGGDKNGFITAYRVEVSMDGESWSTASAGTWEVEEGWKLAEFTEPVTAKYIRLTATGTYADVGENSNMSIAEIRVRKAAEGSVNPPVDEKADKTKLNAVIAEAEALHAENYVDFTAVKNALEEAKTVAADEKADQTTVDAAEKALKEAIAALEESVKPPVDEKADKTKLNAVIAEAEALHAEDYVDFTAVKNALEEAKTVTADEKADQTTVDAAEEALKEAIAALEEKEEVIRLSGADRYETAYKVADTYKEILGVDKFEAVIVATGTNFADALSGSYLASAKHAPILLTNDKEESNQNLLTYIKNNALPDAKIYILGGTNAVSENVDALLKSDGFADKQIERLDGATRYDTNKMILDAAGLENETELLVTTGKEFADSLSVSATGKPVLLVNPEMPINAVQKEILDKFKTGTIYIIGGPNVFNGDRQAEIEAYVGATVDRIAGDDRYETSVEIADKFFQNAKRAVITIGKNYPDGLCGGVLAKTMNAPLILTKDGATDVAANYMAANEIASGYVLGGTSALSDETVVDVFGLENASEIINK